MTATCWDCDLVFSPPAQPAVENRRHARRVDAGTESYVYAALEAHTIGRDPARPFRVWMAEGPRRRLPTPPGVDVRYYWEGPPYPHRVGYASHDLPLRVHCEVCAARGLWLPEPPGIEYEQSYTADGVLVHANPSVDLDHRWYEASTLVRWDA